ncbi:hypothetical protein LXL04_021026 [Taraxacum kok-saghyz]
MTSRASSNARSSAARNGKKLFAFINLDFDWNGDENRLNRYRFQKSYGVRRYVALITYGDFTNDLGQTSMAISGIQFQMKASKLGEQLLRFQMPISQKQLWRFQASKHRERC